jgi:hypothetical protein
LHEADKAFDDQLYVLNDGVVLKLKHPSQVVNPGGVLIVTASGTTLIFTVSRNVQPVVVLVAVKTYCVVVLGLTVNVVQPEQSTGPFTTLHEV